MRINKQIKEILFADCLLRAKSEDVTIKLRKIAEREHLENKDYQQLIAFWHSNKNAFLIEVKITLKNESDILKENLKNLNLKENETVGDYIERMANAVNF